MRTILSNFGMHIVITAAIVTLHHLPQLRKMVDFQQRTPRILYGVVKQTEFVSIQEQNYQWMQSTDKKVCAA